MDGEFDEFCNEILDVLGFLDKENCYQNPVENDEWFYIFKVFLKINLKWTENFQDKSHLVE